MNLIEEFYPKYSYELLKVSYEDFAEKVQVYLNETGRANCDLESFFDIRDDSESLNLSTDFVVACSLFFKPCSPRKLEYLPEVDADGQIPLAVLQAIDHPTVFSERRKGKSFFDIYVEPLLSSEFEEWVPVVYLARDLECLSPLLKEKGIRVISMDHSSYAQSPGVFWRFLAFNLNCDVVYFQDTDRCFNPRRAGIQAALLKEYPHVGLSRPLQRTGPGGQMALILGNDFAVRPASVTFDVRKAMLGYMVLNILHEDRVTNFVIENLQDKHGMRVRPMGERLGSDHPGPKPSERVARKCFPYYGFDEQWLKEFVYYHFSDGRMATYVRKTFEDDELQNLDLDYQISNGNVIISS